VLLKGLLFLYGIGLGIFAAGIFVCMAFSKRLRHAKERDAVEEAPQGLMI